MPPANVAFGSEFAGSGSNGNVLITCEQTFGLSPIEPVSPEVASGFVVVQNS
jgi:hypothetical protein